MNDALQSITEESQQTQTLRLAWPRVEDAIQKLQAAFIEEVVSGDLLHEATHKAAARVELKDNAYHQAVVIADCDVQTP